MTTETRRTDEGTFRLVYAPRTKVSPGALRTGDVVTVELDDGRSYYDVKVVKRWARDRSMLLKGEGFTWSFEPDRDGDFLTFYRPAVSR